MTGFPNSMNITQAPAVEGDRASLNPIRVLPGAAGAWTAGSGGVTIGRFAWGDLASTDSVLVNNGSGVPSCIIAREWGDAMITTYLAETGMTIPAGYPVGLPIIEGDIWVKVAAGSAAAVGMKAYAKLTDGTIQFAATNQSISGYVETKWFCAALSGGAGAVGTLVKMTSAAID